MLDTNPLTKAMDKGTRPEREVFRFHNFELAPARRLLTKEGRLVKIGSRAFDLLVALVERAGEVVSKDELVARVWLKVIVEESNLRVHIASLRRLLGDDGLDSRFIVHVARQGYVFVCPIHFDPAVRPASDRVSLNGQPTHIGRGHLEQSTV